MENTVGARTAANSFQGVTVVGVDVGAPSKGYHAVVLRDGAIVTKFHSCAALEIARWCREQKAAVVAVDAPCRWRASGQAARAAERALAAVGISCFSTPTEDKARGHSFYTWMFAGQELYAAIGATHPIWEGPPAKSSVAIETFPQAVACALAGQIVSAKKKSSVRADLLRANGVNPSTLTSVDEVDAALCAVSAAAFVADRAKFYGDALGGFIVVPRHSPFTGQTTASSPLSREAGSSSPTLTAILALLPSLSPAERRQLASKIGKIK